MSHIVRLSSGFGGNRANTCSMQETTLHSAKFQVRCPISFVHAQKEWTRGSQSDRRAVESHVICGMMTYAGLLMHYQSTVHSKGSRDINAYARHRVTTYYY